MTKHATVVLLTLVLLALATSAAGLSRCSLFNINDRSSGSCFLVDTGVEVSVVPPTCTDCRSQQESLLDACSPKLNC